MSDEIADELVPDIGPVSEGTLALVAWVTGGGIRNRELAVMLEDPEERKP